MKKILLTAVVSLLVLVGCTSANTNIMKGYKGFDKKDHHYQAMSASDMATALENKTEGIYYLGFETCPWCVALVPVMEEAAAAGNHTINYVDTRGNDYTQNADAQKRIEAFSNSLPEEQRMTGVPYVVIIGGDGSIQVNIGTVPGHNAPVDPLTEDQAKFLQIRLTEMFNSVKSNT
ncbi:thioredoxin [Erysipelothrix aquatica]|uniref:thioredoxin n=1 Tax=Erysipelothrix aquatica TaxID=2683714 RepID=UPI001357AE4B|nr:thioredoxin [Erysipelothrix aquatica]